MHMKYTDFIKTAKGIPVHKRLWKQLTAQHRANALQKKLTLMQERTLEDKPVAEIIDSVGLPKTYANNIYLNPYTENNVFNSRYDFITKQITNTSPLGGFAFRNVTVKPTDTLLHELGHAKTDVKGIVDTDRVLKSKKVTISSVLQRLLHPEKTDMVVLENLADMEAFGRNGKLSRLAQLRHHPAIAGYNASVRAGAALDLLNLGIGAGAVGYGAYRFKKKDGIVTVEKEDKNEYADRSADTIGYNSKAELKDNVQKISTGLSGFLKNNQRGLTDIAAGGTTMATLYGLMGLNRKLKNNTAARLALASLGGLGAAYAADKLQE